MDKPRPLRGQDGAALVEFAIVLPLLLLLLYGIISFGAQFLVLQTVKQAASDGARAAVAGATSSATCVASESAATCEQIALATNTATQDLSYLNDTKLKIIPVVYAAGSSECGVAVSGAAANGGCIEVYVSYKGAPIVPSFPFVPSLDQAAETTVLLNAAPTGNSGSGS